MDSSQLILLQTKLIVPLEMPAYHPIFRYYIYFSLFSGCCCQNHVPFQLNKKFMDDTEHGILSFLAQFEARALSNEEFLEKDLQVNT